MMQRRPDWHARLTGFLLDCAGRPYRPGRFDCAIFAAGAIEAMTGVDLAADWRGRYRTLRGGLRVLRAEGYHDHLALAAAHFPAIPIALAQSGDLAVVDGPDGPALGVVMGPQIHALHPEAGLVALPLLQAQGGFRI